MKKGSAIAAAFLLIACMPASRSSAMSPPPKKENVPPPPHLKPPAPDSGKAQEQFLFTPVETVEIRGYFRTAPPTPSPGPPAGKKTKTLPPGMQKKAGRGKELPPGWQKKIARGEVIDAQVYAHSRPLPPDLVKRLPPPPRGTIVVTVEGKVVRLMEATLTILDVFDLL